MEEDFFPYVLTYLQCQKNTLSEHTLICAALGRLRWSLWKCDGASVFSKSSADIFKPIRAVLELHSYANLPRLVNLAQYVLNTCICE